MKPPIQVPFNYILDTLKMDQLSTVVDGRSFLRGFASKLS